jgi:hypothetical protein
MRSTVDRLATRRRRESGSARRRIEAPEQFENRKRAMLEAKRAKADLWRKRIAEIQRAAERPN